MEERSSLYIVAIVGIVAVVAMIILILSIGHENRVAYSLITEDASGQVRASAKSDGWAECVAQCGGRDSFFSYNPCICKNPVS